VGTQVLVHDGQDWAHKCWSIRGMSGHESAGPLRACLIQSSAGTLTCVKMIETCVESVLSTISEQFTIADCFFLFW
jgi:hypothetical protein